MEEHSFIGLLRLWVMPRGSLLSFGLMEVSPFYSIFIALFVCLSIFGLNLAVYNTDKHGMSGD
jgi:hypothetical protein